jgi:hypothetical protein
MANVKITDLTAYTDPLNTDVLAIVDVTNNVTKKVSIANMAKNVSLGTAALPGVAFDGDPNTGIYSPGADQLAISTNGTSRLVVDASGNINIDSNTLYVDAANNLLGLGTSSPGAPLHVFAGTSSNTFPANFQAIFEYPTNGGIGISTGASQVAGVYFPRNTDPYYAGIQREAADLTFRSGNSERARIDSSGRLLVGTIASPAHQLQLSTDSAGKPSTSTWTIVSDERIKEDIELADLDLCYEAIKAIPLKRYKWRDEIYTAEQVTDRRKLGWIAQDVETVFPKAVGTHEFKYNQVFEETIIPAVEEELDADGNVITPAQPERTEQGDLISEDVIEDCRNLNSDQIYAAMYGAVQKLMAKVETLEASNADLLARVAALEAA